MTNNYVADFNEQDVLNMWLQATGQYKTAPTFNLLSNKMEKGSYLFIRLIQWGKDFGNIDYALRLLVQSAVKTSPNTTLVNVHIEDDVIRFYFN